MDNSEKRSRPAPILASSAQDGQTTSGSATPAGICRDPPRTPSYHDSISDRKQPAKRSKSVGRSSSRGKGATSGGEQDEKTRAQAGGSHSSKPKGKPIAYQARVDPAILQLVKACYALYNAEATVDKFRLESAELEKSLGQPLKEMSQEDQQVIREAIHEFGLQRDAAKNERDKVIFGFQSQAWPLLHGLVEDILRQMPRPIEQAPAKIREAVTKIGVGDVEGEQHHQDASQTAETASKDVAQTSIPKEHLPIDQQASANPAESSVGTQITPTMHWTQAAIVTKAVTDPSPRLTANGVITGHGEPEEARASEGPAAMEVDEDKEMMEVPIPVGVMAVPEPSNLESAATSPATIVEAHPTEDRQAVPQSHMTEAPLHPDEILPADKKEKRKLVGQRLRLLETGLATVTSTADELSRKFTKLEEQVLYQEEQMNEYLDTRSLQIEAKLRQGRRRVTPKATEPVSEGASATAPKPPISMSTLPVDDAQQTYGFPVTAAQSVNPPSVAPQSPLSANVIDVTTIDNIRAEAMRLLDERLEQLARDQERRIAEIAQAQEARVTALGVEIRIEIQSEAARAEQAYESAIAAADDKAGKLEAQLSALQAELTQFKQERQIIEDIIKQQSTADQLIKSIHESTLKTQVHEQAFRSNNNTRLSEINDRLTAHNDRLAEYDTRLTKHDERLVEHTKHLADHDSKLLSMSTFDATKEAWRTDMIDMKNHVVGRVDYLEEQVESIKKPLLAARLTTPSGEQISVPIQRTSSPVTPATQQTQTPAMQPLAGPSHRAIVPRPAQLATSAHQQPMAQPQPQPPRAMPLLQAARANPADSSNRLTLSRVGTPGAASSSPATLSHPIAGPASQTQRSGFAGHGNGLQQQIGNGSISPFASTQPMPHPLIAQSQAWRDPANPSAQQPALQLRPAESLEELMRTSPYANPVPRPVSDSSNAATRADNALSGRLNGGQQQRSEASPGALPLRMRLHDGVGVQSGPSIPGSGRVSPGTSEGALGGRLGARMFDPAEVKPPP
ncbi:hypothetical protein NCC49_004558 [Naganishia albida]|nr:hypothetical protein NCC49_004558 [Naganishia albida]